MGPSLCLVLGCGRKGTTARQANDRVSAVIPSGSDESQVVAVLDSMKIEHSAFQADSKTIMAIERDVSHDAITRRAIQLEFTFDAQRKLVSHTATDVFTGP
jgi:hypothetical protein